MQPHSPPACACSLSSCAATPSSRAVAGCRLWRGDTLGDAFALRGARPAFLGIGLLLGAGFACLCRVRFGMSLLPDRLHGFALAGALIGATEELLYRGYVQERLASLGAAPAVLGAAAAHTAYKVCLFALSPQGVLHPGMLALWTFGGGLVFGALARRARSVLPPLLAHALFDTIVYGGAAAPFWVWG